MSTTVANKKVTLAKNYIFNVTYKLLNIIMPLITAPYLSRTVGAEGLGIYAYYYAIAHYFYLFGKMGLNNYGTREIAVNKDNQEDLNYTFSSIYTQQLVSSLAIQVVYIIFSLFNIKNDGAIPMLLGLYTLGCLFDIDWLYSGLEKFDKIAIKNIVVKAITLVAIFLFVKNGSDVWIYTLIMSAGMLVGFFTLWFGIKKYVKFKLVNIKLALKHLKPNAILMFPVLATNIYRSLDKIMLGQMNNMSELGYYDSAEKIVYAISGFITAFDNIMIPKCSNLLANNKKEKCEQYISYTMQFLFFIILLMGSVCIGLSKHIVLIVFGNSFSRSVILLQLLAVTLIFMVWSDVIISLWAIPKKRDKVFLTTVGTGAVINFIFNIILIPKYGAAGACIATIVAEFSVPVMQFIFFRKELNYKELLTKPIIFVVTAIITLIFLEFIQKYFAIKIINLVILLAIGSIFYIMVCILLYFIFRKKDLMLYISTAKDLVKNVIKKKRVTE